LKETVHPLRHEPRWPVALAILALILLLSLLPQAIRLLPVWVTHVLGVAVCCCRSSESDGRPQNWDGCVPNAGAFCCSSPCRWS
jgi:hypothetical protein